MKIKLTSLLLTLLVISSCTSEDDGPGDQSSGSNYFPLAINNYWNYHNRSQEVGMEEIQSEDSLYVAGASGNSYTLDAEQPVEGLTTSLFANGSLKKNGTQLLYTGSFDFMIEECAPQEWICWPTVAPTWGPSAMPASPPRC